MDKCGQENWMNCINYYEILGRNSSKYVRVIKMHFKKSENLLDNLQDLQEFNYGNNEITKSENLPDNLQEFNCYDTKIENLPNTLQEFYCFHNNISKIENLPESLKLFYCWSNQITKIENLPESL